MRGSRDLPTNRRLSREPETGSGVVDAPPEEVSPEQGKKGRRKEKKARARKPIAPIMRDRLRRFQSAVGIVLVVVASIAIAWGIRHHAMTSQRFALETIRVEGTFRRTPEQVVGSAGLEVGQNIFSVNMENARARILQDPWIATAEVERHLPSTIAVKVTEREAAGVVAIGPDLYLCTVQGEIFKQVEPGDPTNLVVITGLMPEHVSADRARVVERIRSTLALLDEYHRRGPSRVYPAQEAHITEQGTVRLTVGKAAISLELGRPPYRKKLLRAGRVLVETSRKKASPSIVFLNNEAHPERVVIRMR